MAARKKSSGGASAHASTPAAKKRTAQKRAAAKKKRGSSKAEGRDACGKFTKPNAWSWKPGASGNPKGRTKRRTLSEDLFEMGQHGLPEEWRKEICGILDLDPEKPVDLRKLENLTLQQTAAAMLFVRALRDGNMTAFTEIFDRLDQKPKRVEVTGRDGGPIQAQVAASDLSDDDAAAIYKRLIDGDELE